MCRWVGPYNRTLFAVYSGLFVGDGFDTNDVIVSETSARVVTSSENVGHRHRIGICRAPSPRVGVSTAWSFLLSRHLSRFVTRVPRSHEPIEPQWAIHSITKLTLLSPTLCTQTAHTNFGPRSTSHLLELGHIWIHMNGTPCPLAQSNTEDKWDK
jgi:hypothetical protein